MSGRSTLFRGAGARNSLAKHASHGSMTPTPQQPTKAIQALHAASLSLATPSLCLLRAFLAAILAWADADAGVERLAPSETEKSLEKSEEEWIERGDVLSVDTLEEREGEGEGGGGPRFEPEQKSRSRAARAWWWSRVLIVEGGSRERRIRCGWESQVQVRGSRLVRPDVVRPVGRGMM